MYFYKVFNIITIKPTKTMSNKLFSILNQVSTKPNPLSYRWNNSISIITFLFLHIIYIERIFSLLQWGKFLYRFYAKKYKGKMASTDEKSQRVNVPSVFVEVYYILIATLLTSVAYFECTDSSFIHFFAIYLLIDTSIWLLYYFLFRRFFEENYAIMHTLEYVALLPFVIICQAACISIVGNIQITRVLALLLVPDPSSPSFIILLGILYTAVILGLVISNLPIENVKVKSDHTFHISIIGNGDVVRNRLLPALSSYYKSIQKYILVSITDIYTTDKNQNSNITNNNFVDLRYLTSNDPSHIKELLNSEIIWIASPSYTHYSYIERYRNKVKLLVVEKPIVVFERELEIIQKSITENWNNVFCLSYYYLEKALPFVFLNCPLEFYVKYLDFSIPKELVLSHFSKIGELESISLHLCEGEDNRNWLQNEEFGGQFFETFIHLVVLSFTALGTDDSIIVDQWLLKDNNHIPGSYILCHGHSTKGVSLLLEMGKYMEKQRYGIFKYKNGSITLNFDEKSALCSINESSLPKQSFTIKTRLQQNYSIQLDMVERCFSEGITPHHVDGSEVQIRALKWMFQQRKTMFLK